MKYHRRKIKTALKHLLLVLSFSPVLTISIYAVEIGEIKLYGNTVEINFYELLKDKRGDMSRKEIESIGVMITNEYHKRGYTTSYVDKFVLRKDGVLEVHIRESKILGLKVSGVGDSQSKEIQAMLVPRIGEIYNKFKLRERIKGIKQKYNLRAVKIKTINYDDSDVFLSVKVEQRTRGLFYGGITIEPIYGLSPEIGYLYPFRDSAINLIARVGYRDDDFRKIEGDFKYYISRATSGKCGFFIGINSIRLIERWETMDKDYETLSVSPVIGTNYYVMGLFIVNLYFREIITRMNEYREDEYLNYDSRCTVDIIYTNKYYLIKKRESTDLKISISGGKSKLNSRGYLKSAISFNSSVSLFAWVRLVPRFNIYYTTSDERFSWVYVYDRDLLGFFNDFTASKWKNTGGLDLEFEVSPEFLYIGPFVNSGYFKDESDKWISKTGGGINSRILYGGLYLQIYYAWDFSIGPSQGGLYILASSKF